MELRTFQKNVKAAIGRDWLYRLYVFKKVTNQYKSMEAIVEEKEGGDDVD